MYCYKCGKEIKSGSSFCKYCGTKQPSIVNKSLHLVHKKMKQGEMFIVKHVALIIVLLLMIIIGLQILSITNSYERHPVERRQNHPHRPINPRINTRR